MRSQFIGTWKLLTITYRSENNEPRYPFGQEFTGLLIYDSSGYVSVQLVRYDRPLFAFDDMFGGTDSEVRAAFEGLNTYFGRFSVDEAAGTVTNHIEAASLPNRRGHEQVRRYEFVEGRLRLHTSPRLLNGEMLTGVLVWERVPMLAG